MGERALSKVQLGVEATHGTAVAADTLMAGAAIEPVNPDRTPAFPEDSLGVRMRSSRLRIDQYLYNAPLRIPEAYFQALPVLMSMGVKGGVTPTEQNASQADWLWAFTPSMTGSNAQDSSTIEVGDDTQAYEIEYCLFERVKLSGAIAQAGEMSAVGFEGDYFGRQVTPTTFTGALSVPTMTDINAKLSRIYVDSTWAGRGTTEVTSLLRAWDLEILTGVHPKFLGSANQYFDTHGESFFEVMLTLTFEGGTGADTEFDVFQAGTKQAVSIQLDSGVQIGSGDNHNFRLDVWGGYEHVTPLDSEDRGNNIHAGLFHALYDPTGAQGFDFQVTTNVAAI
jgi:hypothetical protein